MARLHWFWRATIAVLAASIYMGLSATPLGRFSHIVVVAVANALGMPYVGRGWESAVAISLAYGLPVGIIAVAAYAWVTRRLGPRAVREIPCPRCGYVGHCKNCGYDLTGNISGVCPECGGKVDTPSVLKR